MQNNHIMRPNTTNIRFNPHKITGRVPVQIPHKVTGKRRKAYAEMTSKQVSGNQASRRSREHSLFLPAWMAFQRSHPSSFVNTEQKGKN
jgi:hypothetical protein